MYKALKLASACGDSDITALAEQSQDLSGHEDITAQIFQSSSPPQGPALPPSTVVCQKAALVSFQSWTFRSPGIVGIMLGSLQSHSKRTACYSIVVGNAYQEVLSNENVPVACEHEGLSPCGLVFCATDDDAKDRATALEFLLDLQNRGSEKPLCVIAPWFSANCNILSVYTFVHSGS